MTNEKINRIRKLEEKLSYLIEENMPPKQKLLLLTEALCRRRTADTAKPWQIRFSVKRKTKRLLSGRRTVTTKGISLN